MPMRRAMAAVAVFCTLLGATACGSDDNSSRTITTKIINITFQGGKVTPNGDRITVDRGQPIQLVVKADQAGEIHVHANPERQLKYGVGTTTLNLTIDQTGIITVESHALEKTIVQLEVQ